MISVYWLNKVLVALLLVLLLVAGISAVDLDASALGADSGSGSVSEDDGSASEGSGYNDESNVGSADSEDNVLEDPLDEDYYSSSSGDSFTVSLSNHATGNPFVIMLLALLSIGGGFWFRY